MSISMEQFGSHERMESRAARALPTKTFPFRLQCRSCGFEPEDAIIAPPRCPKCAASAWERFAYPRCLLTGAGRRPYNKPRRARPLPHDLAH